MEFLKENSLWILLAIGTLFSFYWLTKNKEQLKIKWWSALILGVLHTVVGVLSVKVFAVMETLDFSKAGSMSLFGGVFFMPILYLIGAKLFKRDLGKTADVFTPCMIFTVMCARVNCIISGCCLGAIIPGTVYRYPTRELEIVFYIALLIYFFVKEKNIKAKGTVYPLYMALYGAFRFICEFFRASDSSGVFHISHLWAAIAFVLGLSLFAELNSREKKKTAKDNHH